MNAKTDFLLPGCQRPTAEALDAFWQDARNSADSSTWPADYSVRWIGGDAESTRMILGHVRDGNKTGTVHVPEAIAHSGQPTPAVGDAIVLIDFDGTPSILVRITGIETVAYAEITERHTAVDGPRVRALDIWIPVHVGYFNKLLAPAGKKVTDTTPIAFETFEVLYAP